MIVIPPQEPDERRSDPIAEVRGSGIKLVKHRNQESIMRRLRMSILSDFMRLLDDFGRSGNSMPNNADGFASNESGTRQQYAWASRRDNLPATQSIPGLPGIPKDLTRSRRPVVAGRRTFTTEAFTRLALSRLGSRAES